MEDRRVQLFVTCLVDGFFPDVGTATVRLLEDAGYTVEFPFDQTCCGQPAFNAGFHPEATRMVRHTLDVLDATGGPIVIPSGSCAQMLIEHAPHLVSSDPVYAAKASRVAARVQELSRFLHASADGRSTSGEVTTGRVTVTYHPSCHGLRGLGLREEPESLIDALAGVERVEIEGATECCGFGGLFSIEMPEVSAAMLRSKLDRIEAGGTSLVVGGDVSCLMHIEGGLRRRGSAIRTCHIAELLAGDVP